MSASLLSVNVGTPREVWTGKRSVLTSIWKDPVDGRRAVRGVNVDGDDQADRTAHGGPDKAVYAYAIEETRRWSRDLGRDFGPGWFGENLTLEGVDVSGARPGERWAIGTTVLEVSQPRVPCFKLGLKMEDPAFGRVFAHAGRTGAYLRIVQEGELGAGDAVEVVHRPAHDVSVRFMAHALLVDRSLLPQLLDVPELLPEWRRFIESRLGS